MLSEVATIVTSGAILRWHRRLIAKKWDHSAKRGDLADVSLLDL
jgi:hypothetical protein